MNCNCVEVMNEKLEARKLNTVIDVPLRLNIDMSDAPARTMVVTAKKDRNIRKKPTSVFASYCPFCGSKY